MLMRGPTIGLSASHPLADVAEASSLGVMRMTASPDLTAEVGNLGYGPMRTTAQSFIAAIALR